MVWSNNLRYLSNSKVILAKDELFRDVSIKKYMAFDTYDKMIEYIQKKTEQHFYEVLKDYRKIYFDCEFYIEKNQDYENIKNNFKDVIITNLTEYMKEEFDIKLDIYSINISDSSGESNNKYKVSYHFVLSKYKLSLYEMKLFYYGFIKYLNKKKSEISKFGEYTSIIDRSVYKNNQLFRIVGSSKITEPERELQYVNNQDIKKHLVGYFDGNENELNFNDLEFEFVKKQFKEPKKIILNNDKENEKNIDKIPKNKVKYLLFDCISSEKANDYTHWFSIGSALYNTNKEYLDIFKEWSMQSYKYKKWTDDTCCCSRLWLSFDKYKTNSKITLGTIVYLAKKDNLENYKKMYSSETDPITTKCTVPYVDYKDIKDALFKKAYGFSELFTKIYKNRIVYSNKEWYVWNGDLWTDVNVEYIHSLIVHTFDVLLNKLKSYELKQEDIDKLLLNNIDSSIKQFYNYDICKKIVSFIKTSEHLYDKHFVEDLDSNPHIFSANNGIVDLKTGKIRERLPSDKCSFKVDIDYNQDFDEKSNEFVEDFFLDLMMDDKEMVEYLQVFLGYSITGNISEQKFSIFNGVGSNGKSVLMKTLHMVLGKYFKVLDKSLLMNEKQGNTQDQLVSLKGSRIAVCDESEINEKLNSSTVKNLTGGAPITCRAIYKEPITYQPTFQLLLLTNHLPKAGAMDDALWRRLILVPFERQFLNKDNPKFDHFNKQYKIRDTNIFTKIEDNKEAILKWLVNGSIRWYKNGLQYEPQKIKEVTHEYRLQNDKIYQFLETYCDQTKNDPTKQLNSYYCEFKHIMLVFKSFGYRYHIDTIKTHLSYHGYIFNIDINGYYGFRIKPHILDDQLKKNNFEYTSL